MQESLTVFLLDDAPEQRDIWQRILRRRFGKDINLIIPEKVHTAVLEYINLLDNKTNVDLFILDYNLPGFTGISFMEEVRNYCTQNEVTMPDAIIISAQSETFIKNELRNKGFEGTPVLGKTDLASLTTIVGERVTKHHRSSNPEA